MNTLQAGANISIPQSHTIEVSVSYLPHNVALTICAFALNEFDKTRSNEDVIYFNQAHQQSAFIRTAVNDLTKQSIHIDLSKIPSTITKIVFVIAAEYSLAQLSALTISITDLASFSPQQENLQSLILGELYLKNQQWKFKAIGQGFQHDLAFLAQRYNASIDNDAQFDTNTAALATPQHTQDNFSAVMDTIKEELPTIKPSLRPEDVRTGIKLLKNFSWGWLLASLVVFVIVEFSLAGMMNPRVLGSYIPYSFRYLMEVLLLLFSFLIGGAIIGLISPKIRILEPAVAALLCLLLLLSNGFFTPAYTYNFMYFSWWKLIIGGGLAFILAFYGARLGEKLSALLGNRNSRDYFDN
ncbi:MAG: TerD family protein [Methylococcaceae bacterium]